MPLDFPSNPVNGQIYDNFYYDATMDTWRAQGSGAALNAFVNPTITGGTISSLSTDLAIADGGTGASTASAALSNLGAAPLAGATFTGAISGTSASFSGAVSGTQIVGTTPNDNGSTGGVAIKAPAAGSQTSAYLQFVNNAYSAQYAAIEATTAGVMNLSATRVRMPSQPSFLAFRPSGNNWGQSTGTLPFTSTKYNVGNHYNTSNYTFTAPVSGVYQFSVHFNAYGVSGAAVQASIIINGSLQYSGNRIVTNGTGDQDVIVALSVYLNANDYVNPRANLSTGVTCSSGEYWSHFSGHLLG